MSYNYRPVSLKTLQDLKQACAQHGPTAPFTSSLLDSISGEVFFPLTGGSWQKLSYERWISTVVD